MSFFAHLCIFSLFVYLPNYGCDINYVQYILRQYLASNTNTCWSYDGCSSATEKNKIGEYNFSLKKIMICTLSCTNGKSPTKLLLCYNNCQTE